MSGYSDQTLDEASNAYTAFLEKPFTMDTLTSNIQRVLQARAVAV